MFKILIVIVIFVSSCVVKQNPSVVEKGNNYIQQWEDNLENPYSSYPIIQNNTDENRINYDNNKIKDTNKIYSNNDNGLDNFNLELNTHSVVYGDTVYNISKRYDIYQEDLIKWNKISNNKISIGQILFIRDPNLSNYDKKSVEDIPKNVNNSNYNIFNNNVSENLNKPYLNLNKTKIYDGIIWISPVNSSIINYYGGKNKGIDFGGEIGYPVFAVADGKIVYSGSGLKGYGNLIIIQHTPVYLTAYANNDTLLLKKGDKVLRGQQIATMGNSDSSNIKLHFELRKNGKPINPINIIPFN